MISAVGYFALVAVVIAFELRRRSRRRRGRTAPLIGADGAQHSTYGNSTYGNSISGGDLSGGFDGGGSGGGGDGGGGGGGG